MDAENTPYRRKCTVLLIIFLFATNVIIRQKTRYVRYKEGCRLTNPSQGSESPIKRIRKPKETNKHYFRSLDIGI